MSGKYTICAGTIGSGLWLSADGGESWRRVMKGLWSESRVFGLTVHPHEPRTVGNSIDPYRAVGAAAGVLRAGQ